MTTEYYMPVIEIIKAFRACHDFANPTQPTMEWFKRVTVLITKRSHKTIPLEHVEPETVPTISKFPKPVYPAECTRVLTVRIDDFYLTVIKSLSDNFSIDNMPGFIDALFEARRASKSIYDPETTRDIKMYMNMIYGQLNSGPIMHKAKTRGSVRALAFNIAHEVLSFDGCVYHYMDGFEFFYAIPNLESTHFLTRKIFSRANEARLIYGIDLNLDFGFISKLVVKGVKRWNVEG